MWKIFKKAKKQKKVYMDYASATPVMPEVLLVMRSVLANQYANPASLYDAGIASKKIVEDSRKKIAEIIGSASSEIIFTSGGTESNNQAFFGLRNPDGRFDGLHFIVSKIEHSSIIEIVKEISNLGGKFSVIPVKENGIIDTKELSKMIKENTRLVSVMMVNNEIGTIQPIDEVVKIVRKARKNFGTEKIYIHTDACQAPQYLPINVIKMGIDMLTLDSGKIYGPKGIGLLYVRKVVQIRPIILGGGQERGLRGGTEPVHQIAGFAKALEIVNIDREKETQRITIIRDYAFKKIKENFSNVIINGDLENRIANNVNVCFLGIDSEYVVIALGYAGIECAYASSCKTLGNDNSSYVISAIQKKDCASSSLRFTFGRYSKKEDVDFLIESLLTVVKNR